MDVSRLAGKIAADKDSRKLGKIDRIEQLTGKTVKKLKPYAMVIVHRVLKPDVVIPLDVELILKVNDQYAWFEITKEEFDKEVKNQRAVKEIRETYGKFVAPPGRVKTPMNLPRNTRKE